MLVLLIHLSLQYLFEQKKAKNMHLPSSSQPSGAKKTKLSRVVEN